MEYVRPITHELWYGDINNRLGSQIEGYLNKAGLVKSETCKDDTSRPVKGARVLIGPHAGYTYSGERLAETFKVWDTSKVKRIFMLGPSHHVYFRNSVMVSKYEFYETPFGNLPVDVDTIESLVQSKSGIFKYMSAVVDEDEHSFEMHAPFIYYMSKDLPQGLPKIIPIMISGMDPNLNSEIAKALQPYFENEENHFIISSDFCHWGPRFGYTEYLKNGETESPTAKSLISLTSLKQLKSDFPIHKSIENLDKAAMRIATDGSYEAWSDYIQATGNTICGQKPVGVVLKLLEEYKKKQATDKDISFSWIGYSQSNKVTRISDSSVSYASGYVKL
ncbi:uncharacterized protein PRCAT00001554001 [Priceomyces carsonii]|uniref:uncharacterized protein n=1 Tax=Priceomyces carsonii TaxID=28549 RepID=UPI002ED9343E|nr:unnamed protein product [Priceomyces carsonii]